MAAIKCVPGNPGNLFGGVIPRFPIGNARLVLNPIGFSLPAHQGVIVPIGIISAIFNAGLAESEARRVHCSRSGKQQGEEATMNEIGQFIRDRRKANGLTQQELGELVEVGTRFVSELERGKPTVRVDAVNRVLAAFGKKLGIVDAAAGIAATKG